MPELKCPRCKAEIITPADARKHMLAEPCRIQILKRKKIIKLFNQAIAKGERS